jgi:Fis family transcriptional regulator, factor for inversion stimulation protein
MKKMTKLFLEGKSMPTLNEIVTNNLQKYFQNLDGESPSSIYDMVIDAVERPMLEVVMREAEGNQSRASEMLGINRNTLRKKLSQHGLV